MTPGATVALVLTGNGGEKMDDVRNISYLSLVNVGNGAISGVHGPYKLHGDWTGSLMFTRNPLDPENIRSTVDCWSPDPPDALLINMDDVAHVLRVSFDTLLFPRGVMSLKGLWFFVHLSDVDSPDVLSGVQVETHESRGPLNMLSHEQCVMLTDVRLTALRTMGGPRLTGVRT